MAKRVYSVARIQEIQRLIQEGLSDRQIAQAVHCRRSRVKEIRELGDQVIRVLSAPSVGTDPAWTSQVHWPVVLEEIGQGFEIKRIWEERAQGLTGYPNFWKYLRSRYPALMSETITLREFEPGGHCEVDWAGDTLEWWDESRHRRKAHVFVGILCYSQLIFALAAENEKQVNWLSGHEKMFACFGGVPRVSVPDNLKTGVQKTHRYDPDLNPVYAELAAHYQTAVVPARVRSPQDKALVENAVGLVMRLFRWKTRHRRFHSLTEINEALAEVIQQINTKPHTRLKLSRKERWETLEKAHLKALPETPFEQIEWRVARVHPDSTIAVQSAFYSVPHRYRGTSVRVKLTPRQVEVFVNLERVALHARDLSRQGRRILNHDHLPPQAQAYRETTPQHLLAQARFVSPLLHELIEGLFSQDTLGQLRRAQGLIRHARSEITRSGREEAIPRIQEAITQMKSSGQVRVAYFEALLKHLRVQPLEQPELHSIARKPGNPMLRGLRDLRGASAEALRPLQPLPPRKDNPHGTHPNQIAHA